MCSSNSKSSESSESSESTDSRGDDGDLQNSKQEADSKPIWGILTKIGLVISIIGGLIGIIVSAPSLFGSNSDDSSSDTTVLEVTAGEVEGHIVMLIRNSGADSALLIGDDAKLFFIEDNQTKFYPIKPIDSENGRVEIEHGDNPITFETYRKVDSSRSIDSSSNCEIELYEIASDAEERSEIKISNSLRFYLEECD